MSEVEPLELDPNELCPDGHPVATPTVPPAVSEILSRLAKLERRVDELEQRE